MDTTNAWESVDVQINPYEMEIKKDTNQQSLMAAESIPRSVAVGEDPAESYEKALVEDPKATKATMASDAANNEMSDLTAAVEELASTEPEVLKSDVGVIRDAYERISARYAETNPLAPYEAMVRAYPGSDEAPDEVISDIAAQKYMLHSIASIMDEEDYGWGDTGMDILGLLAWPDMSYNVSGSVAEMFSDVGGVEGYITTGNLVDKFARSLRELPPDERIKMFDTLKGKLEHIEDNKIKQTILLMQSIGEAGEGEAEFDAYFDKLDQAGIGYMLGGGIVRTLKSFNTLRSLSRVAKSEREAAVVADIAASSEEGATAVGVSRLDAAASADPNASALDSILDGAPANVSTKIRDQWRMIDDVVQESTDVVDNGLGLTQAERIKAAELRTKILERQEGIDDVRAIPLNDGIQLNFSRLDPDTLELSDEVLHLPYRVDDVTGTYVQKGVTFIGELGKGVLNSPNYLQGADRDSLVQAFERTLFASSKIKFNLNNSFNTIFKGLSKDESTNVGKILMKGDEESTTFSYKQLVNDGVGGIKLSEKEYAAYAGTRKLMDELWVLKNDETRRKLVAKGIEEVNLGNQKLVGKVYETSGRAAEAYRGARLRTIAKDEGGSLGRYDNMTDADIEEAYDAGYVLSRTAESGNYARIGDTFAEWVMVPRSGVKDLPYEVLNKREGYIPRAYENANFFVKRNQRANVSGKDVVIGEKTLRYFDNYEDAGKYLDELAEIEGDEFDPSDYKILGDREMEAADLDDDFTGMYGGLYSGARAEEALKFGLLAEEGKRVDALESIQNYINHIGNRYPLAEYRLGMERRWMNHAREYNALPRDYTGSFKEAVGLVERSAADPLVKTKLKNAHAQIEYMNKVPSLGEQQWAGTMRGLGKTLEKLPGVGKNLAKHVYRLDHTAPVDAMRSATFNLMLGMYNWSQLFVQASGATVAISMRPQYAGHAMANMISFGLLDNIKDAGARAGAIERISKIKGFENVAEEYELWKRSGMFESVVNTNADVASIYKGLPYDAGVVRKVWTNGTLPYKMGELANMRISFGIALQEWKKINKGADVTDEALKSVMARAENFRLSMSRANTSTWQRGWLAIPTQFQQINARFFEAILGNQFTKQDKISFLLGQTAMFGAAGVPFLDQMYGTINNLTGRDISDLTEEDIIAERRGLLGWAINYYAGVDADVTGRVAIAGGVIEQLINMSTEPSEISDLLLGPSASTRDNIVALFDNLVMTGKTAFTMDDLEPADAYMMLEANLAALAQLPASTRNMLLAYDLYGDNPVYRTKDGKARFELDANMQTMISQAVGFQQVSKSDYWDLVIGKKKEAERMKAEVDRITTMYLHMLRSAEDEPDQSRAYRLAIDATLQGYRDEQDRIRVMHAVRERLKQDKGEMRKQVMDVLETHMSKFAAGNAVYSVPVVREVEAARGEE